MSSLHNSRAKAHATAVHDTGLAQALAAATRAPLPLRARAALGHTCDEPVRPLMERAATTIAALRDARGLPWQTELAGHAKALIAELLRLLDGGEPRDLGFVGTHSRQHAAWRLPIEAGLQQYRLLQPLLADWLGRTLQPAAGRAAGQRCAALQSLVDELLAAAGIVYAAEYVAQASAVAEADGDLRAELLAALVNGYDESDTRIVRLLKRAGYLEQRLSFCVALAQSTDRLEMDNAARAKRIVDAITDAAAPLAIRALVGLRSNQVTAVFSDVKRSSGWTAPRAALSVRIADSLRALGPAVLIGLSADQPSVRQIPLALHQATVALDFANVAERVASFPALSIRRLLIHRGTEYVRAALPPWLEALRQADVKARGRLVQTLNALAETDMNVQRAGRSLRIHPNTVYARLQRIHDLTGLDAQRYHDLTQLLLAVDCGLAAGHPPAERKPSSARP